MPRKSRNSNIPKNSLLVPFNILDFGDPNKDPCFGKLYDLTNDTCLSCGDLEWCATIFNQKQVAKRLEQEKKGRRYDLDIASLEYKRDVKAFYKEIMKSGITKTTAIKRTASRYHSKYKLIKTIING